jgi:hypothetical protein
MYACVLIVSSRVLLVSRSKMRCALSTLDVELGVRASAADDLPLDRTRTHHPPCRRDSAVGRAHMSPDRRPHTVRQPRSTAACRTVAFASTVWALVNVCDGRCAHLVAIESTCRLAERLMRTCVIVAEHITRTAAKARPRVCTFT